VSGPLTGIKVLDLSRVLAGPWATQILADLGAEVIKIEKPGEGDETRTWGPPYLERDGAREAAYFLAANRGKKSVCIDIAKPEGARLIADLAVQADVLIENFKVGGLQRYGLDFATLSVLNPRLVYCSITGYGQDGPYAEKPGYDFVIQAMGGMMSLTGAADGEPMKAGVAITDLMTGLYAANAIQAALHHRHQTGGGQHIDLALMDVQVAMLANQALNYFVTGRNPGRWGNAHPNIVPYQAFAAQDGDLVVAVGNDGQFTRLCQAIGAGDLVTDPRFTRNADRVKNRAALVTRLQAVFAEEPVAHWIDRLDAAGVPVGGVNGLDQVFADPQVVSRGLRIDLPHATLGTAPGVASPIRLSDADVGATSAPPALGADTRQVLSDRLGLDDGRLRQLADDGVIS
jgi:crotonobetainyl-CoA:carnitine CoA-transferase CaiB-like acyl-CoA transferase